MSKTDDFFACSALASKPCPPAYLPPPPTASTSSLSSPNLEERLLKAVQDLQAASRDSSDDGLDEGEEADWSSDDDDEAPQEAQTPCDSPALSPTFLPKHHEWHSLKPALKRGRPAAMRRTLSSVSFEEADVVWQTFSKDTYKRRGPSPIRKLTMNDLLELQHLDCLPWQATLAAQQAPPLVSTFDSCSSSDDDDDDNASEDEAPAP